MSVLASLVGSGVGLIAIATGMLLLRHYHHLPGAAHPWAERFVIVLMYAGGSAVAVTQLGQWAGNAIQWAARFLGGLDAGIARAALVIACLFLLASLVIALTVAPDAGAAYLAAGLPLILSLVAGGFLHEVYVSTTAPAQALASALSTWIGG